MPSIKLYNPIIENGRALSKSDRSLIVSDLHYQTGRSAKLLWDSLFDECNTQLPSALRIFFEHNNTFGDLKFTEAIPEQHTAFDNYGKGRMHDLVTIGESDKGKVLIAVEAKVDELFDNRTVATYRTEGEEMQKTKSTNRLKRLDELVPAVFNEERIHEANEIRFQLVQALAATAVEGKLHDASVAIFCILNFVPENPSEMYKLNAMQNTADLNHFVSIFTNGKIQELKANELSATFKLPGNSNIPNDVPVCFLKLEQRFV